MSGIFKSTLLIVLVASASVAAASDVTVFTRSATGDWTPLSWDDAMRVHVPAASAYRIEVTPGTGSDVSHRLWDEIVVQLEDDDGALDVMRVSRDSTVALTIEGRSKPGLMRLRREWTLLDRLDLNEDGTIDGDDLIMMLRQIEECHEVVPQLNYSDAGTSDPWIALPCECRRFDLDFNGVVDAEDVVRFVYGWQEYLD